MDLQVSIHRRMPVGWLTGLSLAIALAGSAARAAVVSEGIAFATANQNPWRAGASFVLDRHVQQGLLSWNVDLPSQSFSPTDIARDALSNLLGVKIPDVDIVKAEAGAHSSGEIGFDFGLYISGGSVDAKYPVNVRLEMPDQVTAGQAFTIQTGYTPTSIQGVVGLGTAGSGLLTQVYREFGSISPSLQTSFPAFNAHADIFAATTNSAYTLVKAQIPSLIDDPITVFEARKNIDFGTVGYDRNNPYELAAVNSSGVFVAGKEIVEFGQPVALGTFGTATFKVPVLDLQGGLQGDGTLKAEGSFNDVIKVQTNVANLISPVPLSGGFPPLSYNLLSASAGPELGISQDFTLTPQLRGVLEFGSPVLYRNSSGVYDFAQQIPFQVGDDVVIKTPFDYRGSLSYKVTYHLDNEFQNKTGLRIGFTEDVSALSLTTPAGTLGPAFETDPPLSQPLGVIPLADPKFSLAFDPVTTAQRAISIESPYQISLNPTATLLGRDIGGSESPGLDHYRFRFERERFTAHSETYFVDLFGYELEINLPEDPEAPGHAGLRRLFVTDGDPLLFGDTVVPGVFCLICGDMSGLFSEDSAYVTDASDNRYYLSGSYDEDNLPVCIDCDAMLSGDSRFDASGYRPLRITSSTEILINSVDEPPTLLVLLIALPALSLFVQRKAAAANGRTRYPSRSRRKR